MLAILQQRDKLIDQYIKLVGVISQNLYSFFHIGIGIDMVGSEYIQAEIISALKLMNVVGNVRQPVGRFSAAFNQYRILIFPKLGGFKPYRSILVIGLSFLPVRLHGPVGGSILIQRMPIERAG